MGQSNEVPGGDVQAWVIDRASKDDAFRQRLLASPRAAIAEAVTELTGKPFEIPESIDVRVVEETPDTLYLVLPSRDQGEDRPLADEQLDHVAAGLGGPGFTGPTERGLDRAAHIFAERRVKPLRLGGLAQSQRIGATAVRASFGTG
jgi:hypothetical protein